jgi:hypothetical protein
MLLAMTICGSFRRTPIEAPHGGGFAADPVDCDGWFWAGVRTAVESSEFRQAMTQEFCAPERSTSRP